MAEQLPQSIREVLLLEIKNQEPKTHLDQSLQSSTILAAAAKRLKIGYGDKPLEQAVLTQWSELFRTGLLAWGVDLNNPNPPHLHVTERGRKALESATRDPSNPAGYLRHLATLAALDGLALAYLKEGLDCYVAGLSRAAAVMVGVAAEAVLLRLRDAAAKRLSSLGRTVPKGLNDWKVKTVADALFSLLVAHRAAFGSALRDKFDASWPVLVYQIRATRNEAGHPASIEPVTAETVHAGLLVFPELARTARELQVWIEEHLA